jgi:hypothetical protein
MASLSDSLEPKLLHSPSVNGSQAHLRRFNIRKNDRKRKNVGGNFKTMSFWECGSLLERSENPALLGFRGVGFEFPTA